MLNIFLGLDPGNFWNRDKILTIACKNKLFFSYRHAWIS